MCLPCQTVQSWGSMEKFFKVPTSAKGIKELSGLKEQFDKHKAKVATIKLPEMAKLIQELTSDEIEGVLHHLKLEVIC